MFDVADHAKVCPKGLSSECAPMLVIRFVRHDRCGNQKLQCGFNTTRFVDESSAGVEGGPAAVASSKKEPRSEYVPSTELTG